MISRVEKEDIVEKTEEFVIESFEKSDIPQTVARGMIRHLLQTRDYLLALIDGENKDTTALEIAALLHGIERAYTLDKKYSKILEGMSHEEKSAYIAEEFLKKIKAPRKLIKKVKRLILLHEKAPTKETKILREADNLSFLENTLPIWFEAYLWLGHAPKEIVKLSKKKIEEKFKQIKSKRGKELAKKYYKKWSHWLEQKEV
ncbi:MAG: HD domain-containing protein [Candidatus Aenigmarchaeota archaeon]|nr:HD domain-containing protein [Candidatus Aenigmarchaeota archaeon]